MDDFIIGKIVEYTNKRIDKEQDELRRKRGEVQSTNEENESYQEYDDEDKLTSCELRSFIGVLLLLGVTKKNDVEISEIWSYDSPHHLWLATAPINRDRYVFN